MLYIKKGREPKSLTEYKKQKDAYYDGCNKNDIRKALLEEQGYLCAYCMRRISEKEMTIEHYRSQSEISHREALDYNNMLGVCKGNRNSGKKSNMTCDAHKGNENLKVNPFSKDIIDNIKYRNNGEIFSNDARIDHDLNIILNLNCDSVKLKLNRRNALEVLKRKLRSHQAKGNWSKGLLEKIKKEYENGANKVYTPYKGVIIWYLNKRIKKFK